MTSKPTCWRWSPGTPHHHQDTGRQDAAADGQRGGTELGRVYLESVMRHRFGAAWELVAQAKERCEVCSDLDVDLESPHHGVTVGSRVMAGWPDPHSTLSA